jgi:3-oxoacyl-[acyl-carrier protein] reductase
MRMLDKVVMITGAGRGIGRETALLVAREGGRAVVVDRDAAPVAEVVAEIKANGGEALDITADVTSREQLDAAVAAAVAKYGRIDVLINNAGITQDATLAKMTEAQFDRVIDINLKGVFNATQAVLPTLLAQGSGKIINASSVVGINGNFGQTNYAATKAGVIGMTKSWAKELGRKGITANAVAPGFIATEMTAAMPEKVLAMMADKTVLGRLGQPSDIAKVYLFLASSDADFITGQVISVDGGLVM